MSDLSVNKGDISLFEIGVNWFVLESKLNVLGFKSVDLCRTENLGLTRILYY